MFILAKRKKPESVYNGQIEKKNPMEGKRVVFIWNKDEPENADGVKGHLEAVGEAYYQPGFYEKYMKRLIDIVLSSIGLVVLSPIFLAIIIAIKIDDPGPVLFAQKRLGKNKQYFKLHKFRSMKMSTPHDVPTHMLDNPDQYITRVGRFLRAHSLDELPQIWDIFMGNMSVIGPRPGLWNQDLLTAERDKYGVNNVKPGLTGWAQINGRDKLEIPDKARLDGEYVRKLGMLMDLKCFLGSIHVFNKDKSVVEGGTGRKTGRNYTDGKTPEELIGHIGFGESVYVDRSVHKNVLVVGAGSYIGENFQTYAQEHYPYNFSIHFADTLNGLWREVDFSSYDIVFHVAGIAHTDVGSGDDATKEKYYAVNTDLAIEVAEKAKAEGVNEFVFMSSMIVYGKSAPYGVKRIADEHTVPAPASVYGDSKLQADVGVRTLANDEFKVLVLRPPMIYGKDSKGNYSILAKLVKRVPVFPDIDNNRSMLFIDNFCEFLCQAMLVKISRNAVVLLPQNAQWTKTSEMVRMITGRKASKSGIWKAAVFVGGKMPGKMGLLVNKAFGNYCYAHEISEYDGLDYQRISLMESIKRTERIHNNAKKHILVISQYFYPETFRINDMCQEWVKRGYKVTVVTGIPNYPMGKTFAGYGLTKNRHEVWNGIEIFRIPLIPRGSSSIGMASNYVSFMVSGILAGKLKHIDADLVFSFEVSPMTQVLTGISFAKKLGVPHYLYVQDLWPENVIAVTGIRNPAIIRPIDKMVDYIYKNTDQVFATSPSFVNAICKRGISRDKVHYWPQYAEEFYRPAERHEVMGIPADGSFKVIFTGNIGTAQGLQVLPQTAVLLNDKDVKFVIVGDGRYLAELKGEVKRKGVEDRFIMLPRQPAKRIPELLAACHVAFLSFQDEKLWTMTIPAKLQSYMACAMPILASAKGETERIINEAKCGVCCKIGDAGALADGIAALMSSDDLEQMGRNAKSYYMKHFDKTMLMDKMEDYFGEKKLVSGI